ncbi:MAG: hypothetical protein WBE11_00500, partial [Candidatus Aminicenantaceae bacterium]
MKKKFGSSENNPSVSTPQTLKRVSTKIIDDVFSDEISIFKPRFEVDYESYLERLWKANPEIHSILKTSNDLESARDGLYTYLEKAERRIFDIDNDLHILEKATVREGIRAFKSIIGPINEYRTGVSALEIIWKLARDKQKDLTTEVSVGFLLEFINLFRSVIGKSNIYLENSEVKKHIPDFLKMEGLEAAYARSRILDDFGSTVKKYFKKFPSGLEEEVVTWRKENKSKILRYFGGSEDDWNDYKWHLKNVISDSKPLLDLIELSNDQKA